MQGFQKSFVLAQANLELSCSLSARLAGETNWTRRTILMNYCVASVHCKKLNYIELIWQKILITERRTQAAKFTSLRNHRFLGRALCGLITNLTSDGCKKV